jgi:hypothetical protein
MLIDFLRDLWADAFPPRPDTVAEMVAAERDIDDDALEVAGQLAIVEALRLWRLDVYDPKRADQSAAADASRAVIDECMRSEMGSGWTWEKPYVGDDVTGKPEWCGFFAARCWHKSIPLATRRKHFPSTWRLDTWARADKRRGYLQLGPTSSWTDVARFCGTGPRAGDIALVGDGKPDYGDHVTLVERVDLETGMLHTVEGNGGGVGPRGNRRQGIVRAQRPIGARAGHTYILRRLIRPAISDLAA